MPRTFKLEQNYYDDDVVVFNQPEITINPGVTVLVGCNSYGKSTVLKVIKGYLKEAGIAVVSFDNLKEGHSHSNSKAFSRCNFSFIANNMSSSEGEVIMNNIGNVARECGEAIRNIWLSNKKEFWLILDAVDSGMSIDNIDEIKTDLFDTIIADCKDHGIDAYIIAAANEYELAKDEQCFDVYTGEYIQFKSYEGFRRFILKSRKMKDSRKKIRHKKQKSDI